MRSLLPIPNSRSQLYPDHPSIWRCFKRHRADNTLMAEHIYKKIELVGSSPQGFQAAVENALVRASETIRNMRWFEVVETRGEIEDGRINHWQVTLKVGFTLDK